MDEELTRLADKLIELHGELGTWERVGLHYDLPKITLWRIAFDGYEPKDNETRHILELSEIVEYRIHRDARGRFTKGM